MKFMMLMSAPRGTGDWGVSAWSADDLAAHIRFMKRFAEELADAGELVMAKGLGTPDQARIVRAGRDGSPVVTDGPFAEAKEFLVGFWIVDVPSAERAYALAARASAAPGHGGAPMSIPIEIREVMSAPAVDE